MERGRRLRWLSRRQYLVPARCSLLVGDSIDVIVVLVLGEKRRITYKGDWSICACCGALVLCLSDDPMPDARQITAQRLGLKWSNPVVRLVEAQRPFIVYVHIYSRSTDDHQLLHQADGI